MKNLAISTRCGLVLLLLSLSCGSTPEPEGQVPPPGAQKAAGPLNGGGQTGAGPANAGAQAGQADLGADSTEPVVELPEPSLQELVAGCPDETVGSLADLWVWEKQPIEDELLALELSSEAITLKILGIPSSTLILRIKTAATGDEVGMLKTNTAGSTPAGEIFAWRMANFLGFSELVAPSTPYVLEGEDLKTVLAAIEDVSFRREFKQSNLEKYRKGLNRAIDEEGSIPVVVKPWLKDFVYNYHLGSRETLRTHRAYHHLQAKKDQATHEEVRLRQDDYLYEKRGRYKAWIWLDDLSEQLSRVMLLDALMSNRDRFPGGNLHMISINGVTDLDPSSGERLDFDMGEVRLLALDNGSSLVSRRNAGLQDLKGQIHPSVSISRFDRHAVEMVRILARRAQGRDCSVPAFQDERDAIWYTYFGLEEAQAAIAEAGIEGTLDYIDSLYEAHGESIYIEPAPVVESPKEASAASPSEEKPAATDAPADAPSENTSGG